MFCVKKQANKPDRLMNFKLFIESDEHMLVNQEEHIPVLIILVVW